MTAPVPLVAMRGIAKNFGAVRAVKNVDLILHPGDTIGLLGENGAGKTTLMNILYGAYSPDAGRIEVGGEAVAIHNSAVALALGIGMVHQHFHMVPRHTVLENLMVGRKGRRGRLDAAGARLRLAEIGRRFHLLLDADTRVGDLTIGEQQRLEIIKALFWGARVLILDEPTAALTPREADGLFDAVRAMTAEGMGVIFISHKLREVRAITSHVMVMRGGELVANLENTDAVSEQDLAKLMCGRELTPPDKPAQKVGDVLLRLDGVGLLRLDGVGLLRLDGVGAGPKARPSLHDISLELRRGEILGIAGVSGNGQRELADIVAGILQPSSGTIEIAGKRIARSSPGIMQAARVGRIPEDRIGTGLVTTLPLSDSMVLPRVGEAPFSRRGVLDRQAIAKFVTDQIAAFDIKTPGPEARTGTLSGGNLQKALLARELAFDPLVLLAAQPTRGLDVGAAQFVHGLFLDLRARGRAVLLISEDLEELFTLSDRIAVMYEGRVVGTVPAAEASVERIGLMMAGIRDAA